MRLGLALPQFDYSVGGSSPLRWDTIVEYATAAERAGYESLWLCDHLFFSVEKYGGPPDASAGFEPVTTLGALARVVSRPRLGTLVICEALRPASVLAKALASLDVIAHGRIDVGLGAGWYAPEYAAIGMTMPPAGVRLARLRDAIIVCRGLLEGGPFTYEGTYHRALNASNRPASVQRPTPPIIVGGKGDRLLGIVAELADGWNTVWAWTYDDYRERVLVLERAVRAGRPRSGDREPFARSLRAVRRGRSRSRAPVRADGHDHAPRCARRHDTRPVAGGKAGGHRRAGAGAARAVGGARRRHARDRGGGGAVRGHERRRRRAARARRPVGIGDRRGRPGETGQLVATASVPPRATEQQPEGR